MKSPPISLVLFISLAIALVVTPQAMPPVAFSQPIAAAMTLRGECDGYLQMALEIGSMEDFERLMRSGPCAAVMAPLPPENQETKGSDAAFGRL